jgi:hypothetical protein
LESNPEPEWKHLEGHNLTSGPPRPYRDPTPRLSLSMETGGKPVDGKPVDRTGNRCPPQSQDGPRPGRLNRPVFASGCPRLRRKKNKLQSGNGGSTIVYRPKM